MKTFEEIQSSWKQKEQKIDQSLLNQLPSKIAKVKAKKQITIIVLIITVAIIIGYFLWIGFQAPFIFMIGLVMMMISLLTRLLLEWKSIKTLSQIPLDYSFYENHQNLTSYYKSRLQIHQIITPVLLIIYWIGFVLLLPTLKDNLTSFWFHYVWISSIPIAIVMIVFIAYHIRKELKTLQQLGKELSHQ